MSYNAREAREQASSKTTIFSEIRIIEEGIEVAVGNGFFEASIGPVSGVVTGLTNSAVAYNAWSDPANTRDPEDDVARYQMDEVVGHFMRKGFLVKREQHNSDEMFNWKLSW